MTTGSRVFKHLALYGWTLLMLSDLPAKFGGDRHCGSGGIMVSVFHVILEDHVTKE